MEIAAEHVRRTFLPDIPSPKLTAAPSGPETVACDNRFDQRPPYDTLYQCHYQ